MFPGRWPFVALRHPETAAINGILIWHQLPAHHHTRVKKYLNSLSFLGFRGSLYYCNQFDIHWHLFDPPTVPARIHSDV